MKKEIFLIVMLAGGLMPNAYSIHKPDGIAPYRVLQYDISVSIPQPCNKLLVTAYLRLAGNSGDMNAPLIISLCEGFKGMIASDIHVSDQNRRPIDFSRDSTLLKIATPQKPDRYQFGIYITYSLVKDTSYKGDPYINFACELSDSLCHINAAITRTDNWYPRIAGTLYDRLPPFNLHFEFPLQFELVASGMLLKNEIKGLQRISHWKNYEELTDRSLFFYAETGMEKIIKSYPDSFRINAYVPKKSSEHAVSYISELTYRAYRYFEKCYGRAPGNEFKILAFNMNCTSGLNFSGIPASLFTSETKTDAMGYPYRSLLHEISHTWWGNIVSAGASEDYWLFEGFARYSEINAIKEVQNLDIKNFIYRRTRLASLPYLDYTKAIANSGQETQRTLQEVSGCYQGAAFLHYIEYIIGEDKFREGMKACVVAFNGKCIRTKDFIEIMQKNSKIKIKELMHDYLYNAGYAEYSIKKIKEKRKKDEFVQQYRLSNPGNKIIISNLYARSESDSVRKQVTIKKGRSIKFRIYTLKENDSIQFMMDETRTFPIRLSGLKGGGGIAFRQGDGRIKFFNVAGKTPFANSGIKDGMELIAVEGINMADKSCEEILELLMQPEGKELRLRVIGSKGEPQELLVKY